MSSPEFVQRNLQRVLKTRGEAAARKVLAVFTGDWDVDALADFAKMVSSDARPMVLSEVERRRNT